MPHTWFAYLLITHGMAALAEALLYRADVTIETKRQLLRLRSSLLRGLTLS